MKRKKLSQDAPVRVMILADFTYAELETKEFEVLKTGEYYDSRYGKFQITEALMQDLKRNFDDKVLGVDVAIDLNHEPEKGAQAWIHSLRIADGLLLAKFRDITEDGKRVLRDKIYKYFSVEYGPFHTVRAGQKVTVKNVLFGIAFTNRPVIKGMNPTFYSETIKKSLNSDTYMLKKLAEKLLKKAKVTSEDVSLLK